MSDYYGGDGEGRTMLRLGGVAVLLVALIGAVWFFARDGSSGAARPSATIAMTDSSGDPPDSTDSTDASATTRARARPTTTDARTPATRPAIRAAGAASTTPGSTPATTPASAPAATPAPSVASAGPTPATGSTPAAQPPEAVPYDTLPDGSPAPVVAIFDVDQITLTGAVPDQAAKDRLAALALANAKPGQDSIVNFLTINPDVPTNVGTRVVELTSARFPEGTADIQPEHARELDRVVSIMAALPDVTTLVIGHADQRGDETRNYELSAARAAAVVDYLVSNGVAPSRLSSRAVGEADLLTLNDDDAALALNRRTEFVFYGLLLP